MMKNDERKFEDYFVFIYFRKISLALISMHLKYLKDNMIKFVKLQLDKTKST